MLRLEHRQMYRPNGLIDDFVLYGTPQDYLHFASRVESAIRSREAEILRTDAEIQIRILSTVEDKELWTALQNEDDFYLSIDAWNDRKLLKLEGTPEVLEELRCFLVNLSGRGQGYSYISEYSEAAAYSKESPEWRLHVEVN